MTAVVYTIGHSNHDIPTFLLWLRSVDIKKLVDIRRHPGSRRLPQFNRGNLARSLEQTHVHYDWQGEVLGGMRELPADQAVNFPALATGLQGFAAYMNSETFRQAAHALIQQAAAAPTAIMCAEKDPLHCHRQLISDYLALLGHEVRHIVAADSVQPHTINQAARLEAGHIYYDRGSQPQLDLI